MIIAKIQTFLSEKFKMLLRFFITNLLVAKSRGLSTEVKSRDVAVASVPGRLRCFKQFIAMFSLCFWSTNPWAADFGYIKHQFINNTGHECYVSVHQHYTYPIDNCLGVVPANETKICDGSFELHEPNFFFYAVCNGDKLRLQSDQMVFLKHSYKSHNIEVIWTIDIKKKKLDVGYHERGF